MIRIIKEQFSLSFYSEHLCLRSSLITTDYCCHSEDFLAKKPHHATSHELSVG
jgi:hypothetical protein